MIKELSILFGRLIFWFFMIASSYCKFSGDTENAILILLWAVLLQIQVYELERKQ